MALLIIIYIAFISLGLPDALLGASWTVMHTELGAAVGFAGVIAMTVSSGTVISSLMTNRVISRWGTGKVVAVSVGMTAVALLGIGLSTHIALILLCAIPLGLGAGAVDSALNNFVAIHYKARHMNWLHCFWGVGASSGPLLLSLLIGLGGSWRNGYLSIGVLQTFLVIILLVSLPLWQTVKHLNTHDAESEETTLSNRLALKVKGVKWALATFLFYCSLEAGTGLWAASYLSVIKKIPPAQAALWTALYYGGITLGRFLAGVIADYISGETMIRSGLALMLVGVLTLILPLPSLGSMLGLILIGLGCAPIYPNMIHLTPARFGRKASQAVIGLSMAFAYIGTTFMPPLIGLLSEVISLKVFPYMLLIFVAGMIISSERLRHLD